MGVAINGARLAVRCCATAAARRRRRQQTPPRPPAPTAPPSPSASGASAEATTLAGRVVATGILFRSNDRRVTAAAPPDPGAVVSRTCSGTEFCGLEGRIYIVCWRALPRLGDRSHRLLRMEWAGDLKIFTFVSRKQTPYEYINTYSILQNDAATDKISGTHCLPQRCRSNPSRAGHDGASELLSSGRAIEPARIWSRIVGRRASELAVSSPISELEKAPSRATLPSTQASVGIAHCAAFALVS